MYLGINTGAGGCAPVLTTTTPRPSQRSFPAPARSSARGVASTEGAGPPQRGRSHGAPWRRRARGAPGARSCPAKRLPSGAAARHHVGDRRQSTEGPSAACWAHGPAVCGHKRVGGTGIAGGCCCPKAASWQVTHLTPNTGVRMGTRSGLTFRCFLTRQKKFY